MLRLWLLLCLMLGLCAGPPVDASSVGASHTSTSAGAAAPLDILGLPAEVQERVFGYMDPAALFNLAFTSKLMRNAVDNFVHGVFSERVPSSIEKAKFKDVVLSLFTAEELFALADSSHASWLKSSHLSMERGIDAAAYLNTFQPTECPKSISFFTVKIKDRLKVFVQGILASQARKELVRPPTVPCSESWLLESTSYPSYGLEMGDITHDDLISALVYIPKWWNIRAIAIAKDKDKILTGYLKHVGKLLQDPEVDFLPLLRQQIQRLARSDKVVFMANSQDVFKAPSSGDPCYLGDNFNPMTYSVEACIQPFLALFQTGCEKCRKLAADILASPYLAFTDQTLRTLVAPEAKPIRRRALMELYVRAKEAKVIFLAVTSPRGWKLAFKELIKQLPPEKQKGYRVKLKLSMHDGSHRGTIQNLHQLVQIDSQI